MSVQSTNRVRVCIVGAGVSGLPAIKCCLEAGGIDPICFERTSDIGGLWRFNTTVDGKACVMYSTTINTSKEMTAYSDFPPPKEWPNFAHNKQIMEYLRHYAEHFNLLPFIRFGTEVVRVERAPDHALTGRWRVRTRELSSGTESEHTFDAVMIATGHHNRPNVPEFKGMSSFAGEVLHSHAYRETPYSARFGGKRVAVVGFGNSALDLAVELSNICPPVYLVARRTAWVFPKTAPGGLPGDMVINRLNLFLGSLVGLKRANAALRSLLEASYSHELYGLEPDFEPFASHPTSQPGFMAALLLGKIRLVRDDIEAFEEHDLVLRSGRRLENLDAVLLATGYKMELPLLEREVFEVRANQLPLYKLMFVPALGTHPTLALVGFVQPLGTTFCVAEMQARLAALVFKRERTLPLIEDMERDIAAYKRWVSSRFYSSERHTIEVDYVKFMDELAVLVGCKPPLWRLFFTDYALWHEVFAGPATAYQWRLVGPNAWSGARDAILTQRERIEYPLRLPLLERGTTSKSSRSSGSGSPRVLLGIGFVLLVSLAVLTALKISKGSTIGWKQLRLRI